MKAIGRWGRRVLAVVAAATQSGRGRAAVGVLLLVVIAGATGLATHMARAVNSGSQGGANHGQDVAQAGNTGPGNGNDQSGHAGATAPSAAGASGSPKPGAGSHGGASTPTPSVNPFPYKTPGDAVNVTPDMRQSNCWVYPRNINCNVYVHGVEYLMSHPAGQVVVQVLIDSNVVASHTIPAPKGGYRYGWTMQFTIPSGKHDLAFEAIVEDTGGNVLAKADPYVIHLN